MSEMKLGFLTGLVQSMSVMPTMVCAFSDAEMGERMKNLKVSKDDPKSRARGMAVLSISTFDHNFVGKISIRVPKLWDLVASTNPEEWKNKPIDEKVRLLENILVCDAQNALAIDWAKKNPDLFVEWLFFKLAKNDLISERYKNAGTATANLGENGKPIYTSEVVDESTGALDGIYGVPAFIHEAFKDVPKTKGLSAHGVNANGYAIWEEDEHTDIDLSNMDKAMFKVTGTLESIKRVIVSERLKEAASHFTGKTSQKLNSMSRKVMRKFTLTNPTVSTNELISLAHEFADVAKREDVPMDAIYTVIGYMAHTDGLDRDTAVKVMANADLTSVKAKVNGFVVYDTAKLGDRLLPVKQAINTFGPLWALAARENGEEVPEDVESILTPDEEQEMLEKLAEEAGF